MKSFRFGLHVRASSREKFRGVWPQWRPFALFLILHMLMPRVISGETKIWGSSSNDIYTVHRDGFISRWDGSLWLPMDPPVSEYLSGIWGLTPNNIYAAGTNSILNWNGISWERSYSDQHQSFAAFWGSSPTDVIAVGTVILRWDGATWMVDHAWDYQGTFSGLTGCWGSAPDNAYAVGYLDHYSLVFHWNGHEWMELSLPFGDYGFLYGIWGSSAEDVFIVGASSIYHWDGATWTRFYLGSLSPRAIWGTAENDVYAVGKAFMKWDGAEWSVLYQEEGVSFISLWGTSASDIYIMGDDERVWRWDGSRLKSMEKYAGQIINYSLLMREPHLYPNAYFKLSRLCSNPTGVRIANPEYIVLDLHGRYWFWPSWANGEDSTLINLEPGESRYDVILEFTWPDLTGADQGLRFWGGICDATTGELQALDWITWSYD